MCTVRYHFAYDEHDSIIDTDNVSSEYRKEHDFHCISCGALMMARLGNEKAHYFAHKGGESCGSETYLHKLAKLMLKRKFDNSQSFVIEYTLRIKCSRNQSCPFYRKERCHDIIMGKYDLKEYYDTCMEEQQVGNYRADLLLTKSTRKDRAPVSIEFYVTHRCAEAKRSSALKIIEIHIRSDNDIRRLMDCPVSENEQEIVFYGFKRDSVKSVLLDKRQLFRFLLFRSGKAYVSNYEDMPVCNEGRRNRSAILELNIDGDYCNYVGEPSIYDYGLIRALQEGLDIKNCRLCKFRRSGYETSMNPNFCCLSKKYGTPRHPEATEAGQCKYFVLDNDKITKLIPSMPPMEKL